MTSSNLISFFPSSKSGKYKDVPSLTVVFAKTSFPLNFFITGLPAALKPADSSGVVMVEI